MHRGHRHRRHGQGGDGKPGGAHPGDLPGGLWEEEDLQRIRFYASDEYYVGFLPEALEKYEFILAVANGDDPLGEGELPLRLVVVGGESNQWVRMVERIECFLKE